MPLGNHPVFKSAPTKDSKVWRYMDLTKFISLLQKKALFFSNLQLFANDDPFEGSLPVSNFIHRNWKSLDDVPQSVLNELKIMKFREELSLEQRFEHYKWVKEHRIAQTMAYRKAYFINCWHLNEYESTAMWEIYAKKHDGIAIVSSERRLNEAFCNTQMDIFGGIVEYGDYYNEQHEIDTNNAFIPILNKRNSFSYENEYRLVYHDYSVTHKKILVTPVYKEGERKIPHFDKTHIATTGKEISEIDKEDIIPGHYVCCDLKILIGELYISPLAPTWFHEVITGILERYELEIHITKSDINSSPLI